MTDRPRFELVDFPGGDLVEKGLHDLESRTKSNEALLLMEAAPRLQKLGFEICPIPGVSKPYSHELYSQLQEQNEETAYSMYNSLLQRIVSFANAYELLHRRG